MSIEMKEPMKPKVIKADYTLQSKIGSGPLDERIVKRCQKVMDSNDVDFSPLAQEFLDKLDSAIKEAKSGKLSTEQAVEIMTQPVMQLKANAAIFRYELIGNLANVMLSFLEAITDLDDDVLAIVDAHQKTLSAIVIKKMSGTGGAPGKQLEDELKGACKRYFSKKPKG
ncbi:MAG: hypothetical protein DHS20C02_14140 [Micavibrio sp.]|nr:MAG: hypothetical protein DHS20C02_14140 [Micavibrio sp.]